MTKTQLALERIQRLTSPRLRVEVALLDGWTSNYKQHKSSYEGPHMWTWWHPSRTSHVGCGLEGVPQYPNDLNAVHDLVNRLTDWQYNRWCDALWNICRGASGKQGAINADARQRCEAYVLAFKEEQHGTT